MHLTLPRTQRDPLVVILKALNELIESLKHSANPLSRAYVDFKYCKAIRANRKEFQSMVNCTLENFSKYSEKHQVEIEMHFYKSLQQLSVLIPEAKLELEREGSFLAKFLIRELNKTLKTFQSSQKEMSSYLYRDNSEEILSNPELYKKLVDTWGDLAEDEY
ncbi:MAG TPA: hypothetical protein VGB63_08595 [Pedobacter sp.]